MGWYYSYSGQSRAELIQELVKGWDGEHGSHKTLRKCTRGNVLWTVNQVTKKETNEVSLYIGCHLLQRDGGDWGYKPLDESVGPCYYTCPLGYLDMVPDVRDAEWREEVKLYHSRKRSRALSMA